MIKKNTNQTMETSPTISTTTTVGTTPRKPVGIEKFFLEMSNNTRLWVVVGFVVVIIVGAFIYLGFMIEGSVKLRNVDTLPEVQMTALRRADDRAIANTVFSWILGGFIVAGLLALLIFTPVIARTMEGTLEVILKKYDEARSALIGGGLLRTKGIDSIKNQLQTIETSKLKELSGTLAKLLIQRARRATVTS